MSDIELEDEGERPHFIISQKRDSSSFIIIISTLVIVLIILGFMIGICIVVATSLSQVTGIFADVKSIDFDSINNAITTLNGLDTKLSSKITSVNSDIISKFAEIETQLNYIKPIFDDIVQLKNNIENTYETDISTFIQYLRNLTHEWHGL